MMKRSKTIDLRIGLILVLLTGSAWTAENRLPRMDPEYTGIEIPPNIAPLNFRIQEEGDQFRVRLSAVHGNGIEVKCNDGVIRIPIKKWKVLLNENRGASIQYEIAVKQDGRWQSFESFENAVSPDTIDSYLAYRLIDPAVGLWVKMGLYQRNLETFEESPIVINRITHSNCMNCHNFLKNDPDNMMLHMRAGPGSGTLINWRGELRKVDTATPFNKAGAYPSWHPSGDMIAFSVNKLSMFFHSNRQESRDVLDSASDLIMYVIGENTVTSDPQISDPKVMETFPCWTPDGKTLYFCSSPELESYVYKKDGQDDLAWDRIRYSLMRIAFDPENRTWGKLETVLSAKEMDGSITEPRVSPDGKYILFTVSDYSNFPIYLKSADLFMLHLETGEVERLSCNSPDTDSFHSWAGNGRWFVFSSKRRDGFTARPYFCHVDEQGNLSKPFVLPQENPAFYDTFIKTYNVPELVKKKIKVNPRTFASVAHDNDNKFTAQLDPALQPRQTGEDEDLYRPAVQ